MKKQEFAGRAKPEIPEAADRHEKQQKHTKGDPNRAQHRPWPVLFFVSALMFAASYS